MGLPPSPPYFFSLATYGGGGLQEGAKTVLQFQTIRGVEIGVINRGYEIILSTSVIPDVLPQFQYVSQPPFLRGLLLPLLWSLLYIHSFWELRPHGPIGGQACGGNTSPRHPLTSRVCLRTHKCLGPIIWSVLDWVYGVGEGKPIEHNINSFIAGQKPSRWPIQLLRYPWLPVWGQRSAGADWGATGASVAVLET